MTVILQLILFGSWDYNTSHVTNFRSIDHCMSLKFHSPFQSLSEKVFAQKFLQITQRTNAIKNAIKSGVTAQSVPVVSLSVNLPFELTQMKMREANCRIYTVREPLDRLSFLSNLKSVESCLSLQETCTNERQLTIDLE